MAMKTAKGIDSYLALVPKEQRVALQKLRKQIKAAAPGASEGIIWGMPSFKYKDKFVAGFAAFKNHCSFFPYGRLDEIVGANELKKYERTKGAIHFTPEKPLPDVLVRKIVKAKIKQIDMGKT